MYMTSPPQPSSYAFSFLAIRIGDYALDLPEAVIAQQHRAWAAYLELLSKNLAVYAVGILGGQERVGPQMLKAPLVALLSARDYDVLVPAVFSTSLARKGSDRIRKAADLSAQERATLDFCCGRLMTALSESEALDDHVTRSVWTTLIRLSELNESYRFTSKDYLTKGVQMSTPTVQQAYKTVEHARQVLAMLQLANSL